MKILVLADPYGKPSFAPRLRFFCEDWLRRGYSIRVITQSFEAIPFEHSYPIDLVPIYHDRTDWAVKSAWSLLTDWRNRYFSKRVLHMVENETYDLVFCTTFSTFPLRAALDVARSKHIPLHVDLRDVDEQVPGAQYQHHRGAWTRLFRTWYKNINIQRRNKVLRAADSISTVSPWHVDWVKQFNSQVHLIYNGYDARQFYFEAIQHPTFNIAYIGKIYDFQHPKPLFQRIERLHARYPEIQLDLHTPDYQPVPISSVGDIYRKSSMAIVLTDPAAKGMMTTKFYEALGSEKPIICYPSDNGLLAETIQNTHAGIASSDLDEIEQYILSTYQTWKQQGYTRQASKNTAMFSRAYQSEQLDHIIQADVHKEPYCMVSVIVPIYNAESYLETTLQSLVEQTYPNLDIILVDDASTDHSLDIARDCAAKDNRIRVFSKAHEGQAAARTFGLQHAKGEWISFVDSDDWLDKNYYDYLLHSSKADVIQFGYKRVTNARQVIEEKTPRHFYQFTSSCMRLYRKSFLDHHHLHFTQGMYYEDIFFSLDVWASHPSYIIRRYTGYNYRLTPKSVTTAPSEDAKQTTMSALRQRFHAARTIRTKVIVALTMMRMTAYFRKQH